MAVQRWESFAWRYTTTAIYQAADTRKAKAAVLVAWSEIRMVGNPEPRAAAEEITAVLGELFDVMPGAKKATVPASSFEDTSR